MGAQRYSPEFKQTVVEELLAGAKRPGQRCREHGIDFSTLRKWREQYAQQGLAAWTPAPAKTATVGEDKIAALERVIGQLTVENMVLKKALQQARSLSTPNIPSSRS
jgi:transposase